MGGAPMNGISALSKEIPESSLVLLTRPSRLWPQGQEGRGSSPDAGPVGSLIMDFQTLQL